MEHTKKPQPKRRTVHLSLWVDPVLKEGLELKAKGNKISVSATGGAYLKKALQQDADIKYGALMEHLDPTFEEFRMIEGPGLHQHWRDALAHEREACFCLTLVEQHRLAVSEAWEESADALAVVLTVEPSIGTIYWQLADKDALLEIVEVFKEHRSLLSSVAVRFDGFINWVVGVFDDRRAFLHVARTPHEPHGLQ